MKIIHGGLYEATEQLYLWQGDKMHDIMPGERFILLCYQAFKSKLRIITVFNARGIGEIRIWNEEFSNWVKIIV